MVLNKILWSVLVVSVAANTCYQDACFTGGFSAKALTDDLPLTELMFDSMKRADSYDCIFEPVGTTQDCGIDSSCAMADVSFDLSLTTADGVEKSTVWNLQIRGCGNKQFPAKACASLSELSNSDVYNDVIIAQVRRKLNAALDEPFAGEITVGNVDGDYCASCCGVNSNNWSGQDPLKDL